MNTYKRVIAKLQAEEQSDILEQTNKQISAFNKNKIDQTPHEKAFQLKDYIFNHTTFLLARMFYKYAHNQRCTYSLTEHQTHPFIQMQEEKNLETTSYKKSAGSRSRGSSGRSREVNQQEAEEYLKRPTKRLSDPNKDLKKTYDKAKHLKDSKFDYIRQLNNMRKKKAEDSISQHGGSDDEDYSIGEQLHEKRGRKMQLSSDSDKPKRTPRANKGKRVSHRISASVGVKQRSRPARKAKMQEIKQKEDTFNEDIPQSKQQKKSPQKQQTNQEQSQGKEITSSPSDRQKSQQNASERSHMNSQEKPMQQQKDNSKQKSSDKQNHINSENQKQSGEVSEQKNSEIKPQEDKKADDSESKSMLMSDQKQGRQQDLREDQRQDQRSDKQEEQSLSVEVQEQKMQEQVKQNDAESQGIEKKMQPEELKTPQTKTKAKNSEKDSSSGSSNSRQSASRASHTSKPDSAEVVDFTQRIKDALKNKQSSESEVELATFTKRRGGRRRGRLNYTAKKYKPINKKKEKLANRQKRGKVTAISKRKLKALKAKGNNYEKLSKPEPVKKKGSRKATETQRLQEKPVKLQRYQRVSTKKSTIESVVLSEPIIKTRAKTQPKRDEQDKKNHEEDQQPVQRQANRKAKKQKETQLNLRGEVADMTEIPPFLQETNPKKKQIAYQNPVNEDPLQIQEGQQFIHSYMRKKGADNSEQYELNTSKKIEFKQVKKENIQATKLNQSLDSNYKRVGYTSIVQVTPIEDKRKRLAINSRVIVQSILYFESKKQTEIVKIVKQRKPKHKLVMVTSDEEEPLDYLYKRKRVERQPVRRYRKIIVQDSDLDEEEDYYNYYPRSSYKKVRKIRYQPPADDESFRREMKKSKKGRHSIVRQQEQPEEEHFDKKSDRNHHSEDETRQAQLALQASNSGTKYSKTKRN